MQNRSVAHKMSRWIFSITLSILIAGVSYAGGSVEAGTAESSVIRVNTSPDRQIRLDGQSNFRDIGGYLTTDGRTVGWRQVFRSGRLSGLSDRDVRQLDDLGIRTVVNFLTTDEIEADGPDRLPRDVNEVSLPMEAGNMNNLTTVVNEARRTGDFSEVSPEINPEIHRALVTEGREIYAAFLREAANPENRPLVFHCSHGVHRTGTATALLLGALGVPWGTIRQDYLLSNTYRHDEVGPRLAQLKKVYADSSNTPEDEVDTTNMEAFYILQGDYIDATLDQAVADYGSLEAYIRNGLGISDEEIETLRTQLLN